MAVMRMVVPIALTWVTWAVLLIGCDVTETTERLAEETVAYGSPPSSADIAAGRPVRASDLAGANFRWMQEDCVQCQPWPHATAIASFGSNGKVTIVVGPGGPGTWRVRDGYLTMNFGSDLRYRGVTVDENHICLIEEDSQVCHIVLQRIIL